MLMTMKLGLSAARSGRPPAAARAAPRSTGQARITSKRLRMFSFFDLGHGLRIHSSVDLHPCTGLPSVPVMAFMPGCAPLWCSSKSGLSALRRTYDCRAGVVLPGSAGRCFQVPS